jgi:hypothetical protein
MGVWEQNPVRARLKLDGGGSSTAFASVSSARWCLQGGAIGWANILNAATISLYEIDAATSSAPFFVFKATGTNGFCSFYLGDHGIQASSSYESRMVLNVGAVAGTYSAMFTGYYTGK